MAETECARMLFADADRVHALLDFPSLVDAFAAFHREGVGTCDDLLLTVPPSSGSPTHFFLRAAWQPGSALGAKLVTIFPANLTRDRGLPSVQAIYVLFDGTTGQPQACIDGTALTYRKTAADSALAARFLAREDVSTMLMVGAGAMAPYLIEAHRTTRPSLRRVLIWNRTGERAHRLADAVALKGVATEAVDDLAAAAQEADLISCATMSAEPLVMGAWLKPGVHLDLVGGFTSEMREADAEAVERSEVYVDFRPTATACGDLAAPLASGLLRPDDIRGDLFELCLGQKRGRERADQITLCKNGGGGHLDLMAARFLLERIRDSMS